MNRREFSKSLLAALTSYALFESLFYTNSFSKPIRQKANYWLNRLNEYCNDLNKNSITPGEWQLQVEGLFNEIYIGDVLKFIDFENLIKGFEFPDLGVNTRPVKFPELEGLPEKTIYHKKIFGMKKGRAIIPHGHSNMASAHLILSGEMHLRNYEKLGEEDNSLIIKPTVDKIIKPGETSSISDEKNNVHWFVANTDSAFTLDIIMLDLNGKQYDIHNLDISEKEDLSDGKMRVPILDVKTALSKYGKETHH